MKKVGIIMGSDSDLPVVEKAFSVLEEFEVPYEVHVYSAHRTPVEAKEFSKNARNNGFGIIIAAAGKAAHLAGSVAANTTLPVIGIPVKSSTLDGLDALLSTVQMPGGIPVATVAIDGAQNAGLLAVQMLAIEDSELAKKLDTQRNKSAEKVLKKQKYLISSLNSLYTKKEINEDTAYVSAGNTIYYREFGLVITSEEAKKKEKNLAYIADKDKIKEIYDLLGI